MATLIERPQVESRDVQDTTPTTPRLWTLAPLWVGATAIYIGGLVGFPLLLNLGYVMGGTLGLYAALAAPLILLAGAGGQYLVLRRGLRATSRPVPFGPLRWIGYNLLATVAAGAVLAVTAGTWIMVEWGIVGDSWSIYNVPRHATDLVVASLVTGGVGAAIAGAVIGVIQWSMLARGLACCAWVRSTLVGWMLGGGLGLCLPTLFSITNTGHSSADPLLSWVITAGALLILAILPGLFTALALVRGLAGVARSAAA